MVALGIRGRAVVEGNDDEGGCALFVRAWWRRGASRLRVGFGVGFAGRVGERGSGFMVYRKEVRCGVTERERGQREARYHRKGEREVSNEKANFVFFNEGSQKSSHG